MNRNEEIYEITRQAVHDEIYDFLSIAILTCIGLLFFAWGLLMFATAPLGHPLLSPTRLLGIGFGLLGIAILGTLWKWDQAILRHLPRRS